MSRNIIEPLYQSLYKMLASLSDEEQNNWYKLIHSEDSECHILATEILNSFENTNFDYWTIMAYLDPYWILRNHG